MTAAVCDMTPVLAKYQQPIRVFRPGEGHYNQEGVFEAAPDEPKRIIKGVLQPITGKDLQRLPENQRVSGLFTLWTEATLKISEDKESEPDVIECNGQRFQVERLEDWSFHGCFSKYVVRKCDQ